MESALKHLKPEAVQNPKYTRFCHNKMLHNSTRSLWYYSTRKTGDNARNIKYNNKPKL